MTESALEADREPWPSPVRARAQIRGRVYHIALEMSAGRWKPERAEEFAELWEVTENAVRRYASEASRMLEWTTNDRERLVQQVELRLTQLVACSDEDAKDIIAACRLLLEMNGMLRQKHDVSLSVELPKEQHLDKLRAFLREPDELTAEALRLEGWTRTIETTGESEE